MSLKVYVVPGLWVAAIRGIFLEAGYNLSPTKEKADIVVWTGGADIHPSIYREPAASECYFDEERDKFEIGVYNSLPKTGGPLKVGICRGAQLLCALSGGKLWQDVEGHGHTHDVLDKFTGELIECSSMHHQEMIPPMGSSVWATAKESHKKIKYDNTVRVITHPLMTAYEDVEAVWIPWTESFCFQPHPEVGPKSCTEYFFKLIDKALLMRARLPINVIRPLFPKKDVLVSGITDHFGVKVG